MRPRQMSLPDNLGKLIIRDTKLVEKLEWKGFVNQNRGRGEFSSLGAVPHLSCHLLCQYKYRESPVELA